MTETALWTEDEIVAATGGELVSEINAVINGVSIDSRTIGEGDVFVAIKGESLDGHDYAEGALKAGAGLAIVERADEATRAAGPVLIVADALKALEDMGRASRKRSDAKIIAVTGSVGKTTTKEALRLALAPSGKVHASVASYNNHWGVPLTLARMPRDTDYGVFEIGMNHPGEITPLVQMVEPQLAIITQIAESHLGHFNSLDDIAAAKAEIFSGVVDGGAALINRDTPYFDYLSGSARDQGIMNIHGFGAHDQSDVKLTALKLHENCSCITATVFGEDVTFKSGAPGEHVAMNMLAVLGAAHLTGADLARAAIAMASFLPAKGRGERVFLAAPDGRFTLIDESYNANPASVRAALRLLAQTKPGKRGRRIAVLGDMLELGPDSASIHKQLAAEVDEAGADAVYACGPQMLNLFEALPARCRTAYGKTSEDLRDPLLQSLRGGDVVVIKGSLGSRMGPLSKAIQEKFEPAENRD